MPKLTNLSLIVLVILFACSSKSKTVIGEWRTDQGYPVSPDSINEKGLFLTIRKDSTVTMGSRPDDTTSKIPGWHVGGKQNGTWKMLDSVKIQFLYVVGNMKYPVVYKIAKLTDDSLILESPLEYFLKLKRLE
jgi:hypothetical protein